MLSSVISQCSFSNFESQLSFFRSFREETWRSSVNRSIKTDDFMQNHQKWTQNKNLLKLNGKHTCASATSWAAPTRKTAKVIARTLQDCAAGCGYLHVQFSNNVYAQYLEGSVLGSSVRSETYSEKMFLKIITFSMQRWNCMLQTKKIAWSEKNSYAWSCHALNTEPT